MLRALGGGAAANWAEGRCGIEGRLGGPELRLRLGGLLLRGRTLGVFAGGGGASSSEATARSIASGEAGGTLGVTRCRLGFESLRLRGGAWLGRGGFSALAVPGGGNTSDGGGMDGAMGGAM